MGPVNSEAPVVFKAPPSGRKLWNCRSPFVVFWGPTGNGKTRIWCEYINYCCHKWPGIRVLMARQFRSSMTQSCMKTYSQEVLKPGEARFNSTEQAYIYPEAISTYGPNKGYPAKSEVVVGGLDDPKKIMSTQYDIIYVNELTDLRRDQWEFMFTRNRRGWMPYQQMGGDCNPHSPKHWVKRAIDTGEFYSIKGDLKENPIYWDEQLGDWTELGKSYVLGKLGSLTGVRRKRLLDGEWVAAEGQIFDMFDRGIHEVPRFTPPNHWRRIWCFDFGFVNPLAWANYVIDPDGFMYVYQEFYHTKTLVEDACSAIWDAVQGQPYPDAIICDHDRGERAVVERAFGIPTIAAYKDVTTGIEAVKNRLGVIYDGNRRDQLTGVDLGRPRLAYMADALIHPPDRTLEAAGKPTCGLDEYEGYLWDTKKSEEQQKGDVPIKLDDHGIDRDRYAVAFEDNLAVELMDEYDDTIDLGQYSNHVISPY